MYKRQLIHSVDVLCLRSAVLLSLSSCATATVCACAFAGVELELAKALSADQWIRAVGRCICAATKGEFVLLRERERERERRDSRVALQVCCCCLTWVYIRCSGVSVRFGIDLTWLTPSAVCVV